MRCALPWFSDRISSLLEREEGQDLIEYALITFLISLGAVAVVRGLGTQILTIYTNLTTAFDNACAQF